MKFRKSWKKSCNEKQGEEKNTPYLFLDEPTNNLDNSSAAVVKNMLKKLSVDRTIILITHDPRLDCETISTSFVDLNEVKQEFFKEGNGENRISNYKKKAFPAFSEARTLITNKNILLIYVLVFLTLFGNLFLDHNFIEINNSHFHLPAENILFLSAGFGTNYEDMNWRVVRELGLFLDEAAKYQDRVLELGQIGEIFEHEGVNDIIITDFIYWDQLYENVENLLEEVFVINPPHIIWEGYNLHHWLLWPELLESGRFPVDGKREILVSRALLREHFNFSEDDATHPLGRQIEVNGKSHTIVGTYYENLAIISNQPEENYGFYTYDSNTFTEFKEELIEFRQSLDWWNAFALPGTFIYLEEGYEPAVLERILRDFPQSEFFSSTFSQLWMQSFNNEAYRRLFNRSLVINSVIAILTVWLSSEIYKTIKDQIGYLENFYLDRREIKRAFMMLHVLGSFGLSMGLTLAAFVFFKHGTSLARFALFNSSFAGTAHSGSYLIACFKKERFSNKRTHRRTLKLKIREEKYVY